MHFQSNRCRIMNTYMKWTEYPLTSVKPGETVTVTGVSGEQGLSKQLINLGLVPGNSITVVSGSRNFPFVLDFAGTRVGITWEIAGRIMVKRS